MTIQVRETQPALLQNWGKLSKRMLAMSGKAWFVAAIVGQLLFTLFILLFYGSRIVSGDFAAWNEKRLITGYVAGDTMGNLMFASHVLMAAIVTLGGLVQLIPSLRKRAMWFHKWNGRVFMTLSLLAAIGGIWLVWGRGSFLSITSGSSVSFNGVLIVIFAVIAWRAAVLKRIESHRRWAMRTFMVVNGVWFFRVGLMATMFFNQDRVGMTRKLDGPVDTAIQLSSYLIPLALLELYFFAQSSRSPSVKILTSAVVILATAVTILGTFGSYRFLWSPYMFG